MNCPRDHVELRPERHRDIEVDRCPTCKGGWLDEEELSQLEATVESTEEQRRATIQYSNRASELACPKCAGPMTTFNYRAYSLELDVCDQRHGFWLDEGEAIRVREIIEERVEGLDRAAKAEAGWDKFLDDLRGGGSFWSRLSGR